MPLPDFLVAGAMKAGTTTLYAMLDQHPAVYVSTPKELHFFDRHFKRGPEWYAEQFTPGPEHAIVGEATPMYMADPLYRERMHSTLPDARILIILREPASRAYSHYWMMRAKGIEDLETFEAGLAAEDGRWETCETLREKWWYAYHRRGHYSEQIRAVEKDYGRDRMHVMLFEDLIAAPQEQMRQVFDFLGVDSAVADSVELVHKKSSKRALKSQKGYPPMAEETRRSLREYYAPHNADLEAWLGRELPGWRP